MNLHDLIQQWDQSVQNLQSAEESTLAESELKRSTPALKTGLNAGSNYQCWGSKDNPTCGNCTQSWTYSVCE